MTEHQEGGSGTETHNDLSGEAQAAAQVRTVYGGIHMYRPENADRLPRRWPLWQVSGCVALIVVTGVTAVVVLSRRQADSLQGGLIPPTHDSAVVQPETSESQEETGQLFEFDLPPSLEAAPSRQEVRIPEPITVTGFQSYRCAESIYSRMVVATARMPKRSPVTAPMLYRYAEKIAKEKWGARVIPRYGMVTETGRWSLDSSHYHGLQLDIMVKSAAADLCEAKFGLVKILVLDHGNSHLLFAVAADLTGDPAHAPIPDERDVGFLFESARPQH